MKMHLLSVILMFLTWLKPNYGDCPFTQYFRVAPLLTYPTLWLERNLLGKKLGAHFKGMIIYKINVEIISEGNERQIWFTRRTFFGHRGAIHTLILYIYEYDYEFPKLMPCYETNSSHGTVDSRQTLSFHFSGSLKYEAYLGCPHLREGKDRRGIS